MAPSSAPASQPPTDARVLARLPGRAGELVLREHDGVYEIISSGTFLMDTHDGRSEELLVDAALEAAGDDDRPTLLLAGLGVGFSLARALSYPNLAGVHVVEWEPAIVAWNRELFQARTGGDVDDPRVRCEIADVVDWLRRPSPARFDGICLDVDNGPGWTVHPRNRWLYSSAGLDALHRRLVGGGALTVWSAAPSVDFEQRLRARFGPVDRLEVPVERGVPDVIYRARR